MELSKQDIEIIKTWSWQKQRWIFGTVEGLNKAIAANKFCIEKESTGERTANARRILGIMY